MCVNGGWLSMCVNGGGVAVDVCEWGDDCRCV